MEVTKMTKVEKAAKMAEHKAEAVKLAVEYNEANDYVLAEAKGKAPEGVEKPRPLTDITDDIDKAVKEYNTLSLSLFYEECMDAPNPMLEAVRRLEYPVISMKDEKPEPGAAFTIRVIKEAAKIVDLLAFNNKHAIGSDNKWPHTAQRLNCLITADRAKALGIPAEKLKTINNSLQMSSIAKDIDLGKNPTAAKNLKATMQNVVDQMLGAGHAVQDYDVNYIAFTYSSAGKKALSVKCSDHKGFVRLMARMCHRIVTNGMYEIESKVVKIAE
jgi:hypothetical protein